MAQLSIYRFRVKDLAHTLISWHKYEPNSENTHREKVFVLEKNGFKKNDQNVSGTTTQHLPIRKRDEKYQKFFE